jgi:hypothetical protein
MKPSNIRATTAFGAEAQNIRVVSSLITPCGHFRRENTSEKLPNPLPPRRAIN